MISTEKRGGTPTMKKRILALFLVLASLVTVLSGCAGSIKTTSEYKGQQITMYLTETIYDLDPARAYKNESTKSIVSLLFGTLFTLDEKGKVQPYLAKSYTIEENKETDEYYMYITIADTNWSDNTPVTADDVVFAWKRLLDPNQSFEAAALLFDIVGAREYNESEVTEDDVMIIADNKLLTIQFNGPIDYDHFLLNLTSLALAPLREGKVVGTKGEDWAKKPGTMVCSGPFKLGRISFSTNADQSYSDMDYDVANKDDKGKTYYEDATTSKNFAEQIVNSFILERNSYYFRTTKDNLDASVAPYRILVDCAMSDADIKEAYESGAVLYIGDIPMSIRNDFKDTATVKDSLSTNTIYLNENAVIGGEKLFANKAVRQALSMVIDREAIANALVFAEAATGLVPTGVFDTNSAKSMFRDNASGSYKYLTKDVAAAQKLLSDAGIKASNYSFSITYAAYDEVHTYIAEAVAEAWKSLGFKVTLNKRGTVANNDYDKYTDGVPTDICDDLYAADLAKGEFEAIILDLVAPSADPFSVLAPFAKQFSGQKAVELTYELTPHVTGYDSAEYNAIMEKVFTEKTIANRSADLHKAEDILMEDMPVIPVVFNKTAYVVSDDLKLNNSSFIFWKKSSSYYTADTLEFISVGNYEEYLAKCSSFLESKHETYRNNPLSYFGSETLKVFSFEEFKQESSNYAYLWKAYDKDGKLIKD